MSSPLEYLKNIKFDLNIILWSIVISIKIDTQWSLQRGLFIMYFCILSFYWLDSIYLISDASTKERNNQLINFQICSYQPMTSFFSIKMSLPVYTVNVAFTENKIKEYKIFCQSHTILISTCSKIRLIIVLLKY